MTAPIITFLGEPCKVIKSAYPNGNARLDLICSDGSHMATATGFIDFRMGDRVLIKSYGENTGVLEALIAAGLVEDTKTDLYVGYGHLDIVTLKGALNGG